MTATSWADIADRALAPVFGALPRDASDDAVRRAVREAYPFGARAYWPYKVWLARVKAWRSAWRQGLATPAPARRQAPVGGRRDTATGDLFQRGAR